MRLVVQHAVAVQDERGQRFRRRAVVGGEFPVARQSAPDRVRRDTVLGVEMQRRGQRFRRHRRNLDDLGGAAVQRRRLVQHQAVHHALGRPARQQPQRPFAGRVDDSLDDARQRRGDLHQMGQLVQHQPGARGGAQAPRLQDGRPVAVRRGGEARYDAPRLDREGVPLHAGAAEVAQVVSMLVSAQRLLQQPRLAAPAPPVHDDQGAARPGQGAAQAGQLADTVEKREPHALYSALRTVCVSIR